ncbi:NAD(P)/FAD-dependent oxidoreductase [Aeromicrobium tamlense]|uniref:NAD(P)/FAD-dependent oxidoreductase n=1 Tax=Aeromicrobium tamlense TaxID=375541 RepID=A0A8I0KHZ0_9ACTN|nr:NAD(P)/FAD-dependent oxidoreductase [Aeromicrobium tamlense]MBD1270362.1 NAD(P)/FAD-dependent oxidoreductase [Aeromicrobium tamlense]MBD1271506.1 NAD(P)/FAD-dependent oxidoreductase [Aeromicrobium tamlense]NYI37748.1 phytoene dehydrogenase-like protein [Aeromicrobium tamlense]
MTTAVVVGSGPNGLAAALTLAAAGVEVEVLEAADEIGGGTRSGHYTVDGVLHDECSGFHPLAVDTAFSRAFDLAAEGLAWRWPEVQYAHPLDGGSGAAVWRDVDRTAQALGESGAAYRRLFGPLSDRFDKIATEFLQPIVHVPRHPIALAGFGVASLLPATWLGRMLRSPESAALFAGVAAHAFRPLGSPLSSAIGVALGTAAHRYGWPVAEGGTAAISRAMEQLLAEHGGKVTTGVRVTGRDQLAHADIVMLDTTPGAAADILGDALPPRVARAYRRYRYGPGAFQVALAVEGGIPWTHEPTRAAGTVHLGGSMAQIATAEREVWRGRMPERPFVLLGQQSQADPGRRAGDVHPIDAYAHVPSGYDGDATEAILAQIERFAPGVRERVVGMSVRSTEQITRDNANYVGGDIVTGANTPRQLIFRPRVALDPYATGVPGTWLCSAATPPGAGAHGMCGHLAARRALRRAGIAGTIGP